MSGFNYSTLLGTSNLDADSVTCNSLLTQYLNVASNSFVANSYTYTLPAGSDQILTKTATQTVTNKTISSSSIDSTPIGSTTPSTGAFTTISLSSLVPNQVLVTDGSKNISNVSLSNGQLLIGNGGSYTAATLQTTSSNMSVSNGAGSILINLSSTPTFSNIVATNLNSNRVVVADTYSELQSVDMPNGSLSSVSYGWCW